MKISIQMLSIESVELFFLFDYQHRPIIEVQGVPYSSLGQLLQLLPQLTYHQHLVKFAQITNFLATGLEFQYIEDIEGFKESYYQQMEAEQISLLEENPALKDYGIFDLSLMHLPSFKDHTLIFFVKHEYSNIPYQVTSFYSIENDNPQITYKLLPLVSEPFFRHSLPS